MATSTVVTKSGGNFVVTTTIPEADIADGSRESKRLAICSRVSEAGAAGHLGIQKPSDAELDADQDLSPRQVAKIKAGRWTFTGV